MPVRCQLKIAFEDMDATGGDEGIEGLDTLVVEIRGMGKKRLGCVAKLLCCAPLDGQPRGGQSEVRSHQKQTPLANPVAAAAARPRPRVPFEIPEGQRLAVIYF